MEMNKGFYGVEEVLKEREGEMETKTLILLQLMSQSRNEMCNSWLVREWLNIFVSDNICMHNPLFQTIARSVLIGLQKQNCQDIKFIILSIIPSGR